MIAAIKKMLGLGPEVNYAELVKNGALIIDVRSKSEYQSGHIKGSVNIPLDQLSSSTKLPQNKEKAIITCCASGMRSASGKSILKSKGYTEVHNGGGWYGLNNKL